MLITLLLTFVLLGSPGPAPVLLAFLGMQFGMRKSLPFLGGILLGLFAIYMMVAFGVKVMPVAWQLPLHILSIAYLGYLAYRFAFKSVLQTNTPIKPPGFVAGVITNLINPKAYLAIIAIAQHSQEPSLINLIASFLLACVIDLAWLMLGANCLASAHLKRYHKIILQGGAWVLLGLIAWLIVQLFSQF